MTREELLTKITEMLDARGPQDEFITGFLVSHVLPLVAYRPKAEQEEALKVILKHCGDSQTMDGLWDLLRLVSGNSSGTTVEFGNAIRALEDIDVGSTAVLQAIEQNVFPLLLECSDTELTDFFRVAEKRFRLGRKDKHKIELSFQGYQERKKIELLSQVPKEDLDDETKERALEYLKNPDLFPRLLGDFGAIGLVGEKENATILYLICMSAKLRMPLHAAVFGTSSGGKTSLVKSVMSLLPMESKLIIGSSSARAFEYVDPSLIENRVVFVEEFEGMQKALDTLRLVMSESNASRLVAVQDPKTNTWTSRLSPTGQRFSLITSTTRPFIPQETSNRMLCLFIDQTRAHLEMVGEAIKERHTITYKWQNQSRERIRKIHHAIHVLLKPVEVHLPFARMIRFPHSQARHSRDLEKFLSLIEVIAFIRQYQKTAIQAENASYVEADIEDYRIAYDLLPFALSEGFEELSKPEADVLKLAVLQSMAIQSERKTVRDSAIITTRAILELAKRETFDVGDQTKIGQLMNSLEYKGFVESQKAKKQGSKQKYILAFDMTIDNAGNLVGPEASLKSQVSTPEELQRVMKPGVILTLEPNEFQTSSTSED